MIPDPCCVLCKSSTGICLTRHQCEHHKEADKRDEAAHRARQTIRRPTEDKAIANITRAGRRRK
ncbi:hypothetical protein J2T10_001973 [Paenarthrobacter nicotinovorans]|jgi:hypothetical protein|uniref:Uncharacterized protein n=1 Tax=Paenarthrobacter nicotinovorans TaxID=29320 RepID=A0ABT9TPA6_PAENI|nr:hypothetical protein [Paenarthrobacter nicotinovorans]MDQ0102327.1 hypothetical protein [Paenarthrobacter nicotinovorans]